MKGINNIPIDIINQILKEFMREPMGTGERTPITSKELLKLRLISKVWSEAVLLFKFQKLTISDSERTKRILEYWNEDLFGPPSRSPVKTLVMERIWYSKEDDKENKSGAKGEEESEVEEVKEGDDNSEWEDEDSEKGDDHKLPPPLSVNQVTRLIDRLGTNLNSLTLRFVSCMGVSLDLIKAIGTIKDLKSLTILYSYHDLKGGIYDTNSISKLLAAIPQLESLTVHPSSIFDDLVLKPPALSNLRHLSSTYDDDLQGLSSITSYTKNTLKSIQLFPISQDPGSLIEVLKPVKDTLEGLFTLSFTGQIKEDLTNLTFPKLRVIASQHCPGHFMREIDWLNVPMLKNVRTIITDLFASEESWLDALRFSQGNAFKSVPNIKHIVFTGNALVEHNGIHPQLIKFFEANGVQAHLSEDSSWDKTMKLDYKLNGPMNL